MTDSSFPLPSSPVGTLGTMVLMVAYVVNAYALMAGLAGQRRGQTTWVTSARHATYAFTALMMVASSLIVYAFLSHDYTIRYVAHYSDLSMPFFYKITAYWGGLDGSLLFWVAVLSLFTALAVRVNHRRHPDLIGYVIATICAVQLFFLSVLIFTNNPFASFMGDVPLDGKGLNPLLQNYWMVIHPPSLYLGFVGMTIPFAFCIAALASGRLDDAWLRSVRVWVIIAWFFLSLGLTLGGIWAYEELGWGGYWAWDPVENAALIPWFTATAFLHSIMIQERKGMLKVWNVVLMVTTFFLTIFGTFMTRSGVVQSVHAFGEDPQLALLFVLFMALILVVSFGLILHRLPRLGSTSQLESFASREFAFLLNNWVLLGAAFFVLFSTMFPTLSQAIVNERITVGEPWFNRFMVPTGLGLLGLMGVGPLLAWRVTSGRRLAQQFVVPVVCGVLAFVGSGLAVYLRARHLATEPLHGSALIAELHLSSVIAFGLVGFALGTITQEFVRATRVRMGQSGGGWLGAFVGITLGKARKFGGYVVHLGVAIMFIGFAGKSYRIERDATLTRPGETVKVADYTFRYDALEVDDNANRTAFVATVTVLAGDREIAVMHPARNQYKKGEGTQTTEVAIERRLDQDIYLVLNGFDGRTKLANFRIFLHPLVNWVWIGFAFLGLGTLIALLQGVRWAPSAVPRRREEPDA